MLPVLLEFNTWQVRSYDAVLIIAILTGLFISYRDGVKKGFQGGQFAWLIAGTLVFALVGARINGWLFWFSHDPEMLSLDIATTRHGMTAFGGIAGAILFSIPFAYIQRWNPWRLLDIIGPVMVLCEGIQRIGCLLNGCCYGKETAGFPGIYLPDIMGIWTTRYPVQLVTGIFCLLLFVYLKRYGKSKLSDGEVFLQYVILYPTGRLLLDFMRGDEPSAFGIFSAHQVASLLMVLAGAMIITWRLMTVPEVRQLQK